MKIFSKKLFLLPLIFHASTANATLYKITFSTSNYVDQNTPTLNGTLNGFIVIDDDIGQLDTSYTAGSDFGITIPNWLVNASLTFTPNSGTSETRSLSGVGPFTLLNWKTSSGSFDPNSEFVGQMSAFGFSNGGNFSGAVGGDTLIQRFDNGEFALTSPASTQTVPGPVPLLGLVPFAFYFHKLKTKLKKK